MGKNHCVPDQQHPFKYSFMPHIRKSVGYDFLQAYSIYDYGGTHENTTNLISLLYAANTPRENR